MDPGETICEPVGEGQTESDARAETDEEQSATTVCLETLGLPGGDGRREETVGSQLCENVNC